MQKHQIIFCITLQLFYGFISKIPIIDQSKIIMRAFIRRQHSSGIRHKTFTSRVVVYYMYVYIQISTSELKIRHAKASTTNETKT